MEWGNGIVQELMVSANLKESILFIIAERGEKPGKATEAHSKQQSEKLDTI